MTYFIYLKIFKTLIFLVLVFGIPYAPNSNNVFLERRKKEKAKKEFILILSVDLFAAVAFPRWNFFIIFQLQNNCKLQQVDTASMSGCYK